MFIWWNNFNQQSISYWGGQGSTITSSIWGRFPKHPCCHLPDKWQSRTEWAKQSICCSPVVLPTSWGWREAQRNLWIMNLFQVRKQSREGDISDPVPTGKIRPDHNCVSGSRWWTTRYWWKWRTQCRNFGELNSPKTQCPEAKWHEHWPSTWGK